MTSGQGAWFNGGMQITTATINTAVNNAFMANLQAATGDQLRMAWEALNLKASAAPRSSRSCAISMGKRQRVQAEMDRRGLRFDG